MKRALFLFVILFQFQSFAKTLLISDVDDTLRLTQRLGASWLQQLDHVKDPELAFVGLPEVVSRLWENGADIFYVSATVSPLHNFTQTFLDFHDFPQKENLFYKSWLDDALDFKIETIQNIIDESRPDVILLFGDNGEQDVAAYEVIAKQNHNVFIFIHKLYEGAPASEVPASQMIFLTGADLAVSLESLGLLSAEQANLVIEETLSTQKKESYLILPEWAELTEDDFPRVREQIQNATDDNKNALKHVLELELGARSFVALRMTKAE